MQKENNKIAIIGGGASGLVAGIIALRNGGDVSIFEKSSRPARKILASGNGRCNISNENIHISRYHGEDLSLAKKVLDRFDEIAFKKFFQSIGLEIFKQENGKYFPLSLQASSISDALVYEFKTLGGNLYLNNFVEKIEKKNDKFILHVNSSTRNFDKVLISSGSPAMEKLGSSSSGYEFAKGFGHEISPLFPSLVQLICKGKNQDASGVKFQADVSLCVENQLTQSIFGDLLLTNYDLSGSAILDISRQTSKALMENKNTQISLDCLRDFSRQKLTKTIENFAKNSPNKPINLLLNGLINKKLANLIIKHCNIPHNLASKDLNKKHINALSYTLKNLKYTPAATKGFENAEVVAGGVKFKDLDANLQSKLVKGLYFSGEVLDIDGDCGGFNLHWAWASGFVCGEEMAKT
ncbi:MAG: aminoacetone oxidase family FAD-binding enzyme [Proteobacteria bacterium]|nr:MAG: aminoacetone oxidase family FAD-binding enzyme [Pseudomonadota bacterium]